MTAARAPESSPLESVILVDEVDRALGIAEKQIAHLSGRLHRAFSIFVVNEKGQLLLQRRSACKYHSGGLWANTCCGHPRPGEATAAAAQRRLNEEFGFDCALIPAGQIRYRAEVSRGLTENEYVHVFVGQHTGDINPDPTEISEHQFVYWESVVTDVQERPDRYAPWFRIYLSKYLAVVNTAVSSVASLSARQ